MTKRTQIAKTISLSLASILLFSFINYSNIFHYGYTYTLVSFAIIFSIPFIAYLLLFFKYMYIEQKTKFLEWFLILFGMFMFIIPGILLFINKKYKKINSIVMISIVNIFWVFIAICIHRISAIYTWNQESNVIYNWSNLFNFRYYSVIYLFGSGIESVLGLLCLIWVIWGIQSYNRYFYLTHEFTSYTIFATSLSTLFIGTFITWYCVTHEKFKHTITTNQNDIPHDEWSMNLMKKSIIAGYWLLSINLILSCFILLPFSIWAIITLNKLKKGDEKQIVKAFILVTLFGLCGIIPGALLLYADTKKKS